MSSSRVLLSALLLFPTWAAADEVRCPDKQADASLASVSLFDGPPSEMADLVPDESVKGTHGTVTSTWDVSYIFQAGRHVYLQCKYGGNIPPIELEGKDLRSCAYVAGKGGSNSMVCK